MRQLVPLNACLPTMIYLVHYAAIVVWFRIQDAIDFVQQPREGHKKSTTLTEKSNRPGPDRPRP